VTPEQLGVRLVKVVEKSPATLLASLPSHASLVMGIKPGVSAHRRTVGSTRG
jgi:hypothetical protein